MSIATRLRTARSPSSNRSSSGRLFPGRAAGEGRTEVGNGYSGAPFPFRQGLERGPASLRTTAGMAGPDVETWRLRIDEVSDTSRDLPIDRLINFTTSGVVVDPDPR